MNGAPADDVLRVIGGAEDALEEVVSLDFQERVLRVDAVGAESLQHELALPPEPIAVGRQADLFMSRSTRSATARREYGKQKAYISSCCENLESD